MPTRGESPQFDQSSGGPRPSTVFLIVSGSVTGWIGASCVSLVVLIAVLGPHFAPYSPTAIGFEAPGSGPSYAHLLGTDTLGRDVFSRFLNGGLLILILRTLATLLGFGVGGVFGLLGGYKGGVIDLAITRAVDVVLSVPPLLIVMVMVVV